MRFKLTLAIIASFVAAPAVADGRRLPEQGTLAATPARGVYVGAFGGWGVGTSTNVNQLGTAFFIEAQGGPLAVNATGQTDSGGVGFIGGQIGYEFSHRSFVQPAFELEGLYLRTGNRSATVNSPTDRLDEHTFDNSFSIRNSVYLANMVLSFPTLHPGMTPYIGGGIGGARVSVSGANSLQIAPPEAGVNHFNSNTDSSVWTFAAQAKVGVRVALGAHAYVFGEYRYLYVGSNDQIFGNTVYPDHAATTAWTVRFDDASYHLGTVGIGVNI
jgi:opacity protein-like surface antigen